MRSVEEGAENQPGHKKKVNHPAFCLKIKEKPSKTSPGETCLDHSLKVYNE